MSIIYDLRETEIFRGITFFTTHQGNQEFFGLWPGGQEKHLPSWKGNRDFFHYTLLHTKGVKYLLCFRGFTKLRVSGQAHHVEGGRV